LAHFRQFFQEEDYATLPDLIILDHLMPGLTGFELLEGFDEITIATPFVVVSGYVDENFEQRALEAGAAAVFDKTEDIHTMIPSLRGLVHQLAPRKE